MGLLRRKGFLAAVTMTALLGIYMAVVAGASLAFIRSGDPVAVALGAALLVLPLIGLWWLAHEWRLGTTVQRMADALEREGRLPIHDGEQDAAGKLTEEAQAAVFEMARLNVENSPTDWAAWFHVAYAYEAAGDRSMARKSLRHAADLYRASMRERARASS